MQIGNSDTPTRTRERADAKSTFVGSTRLAVFFRALLGSLDGLVLICLAAIFLVISFILFTVQQFASNYYKFSDLDTMRGSFLMMPLVLIAAYVSFSLGGPMGKNSVLGVFILLVAPFIPF